MNTNLLRNVAFFFLIAIVGCTMQTLSNNLHEYTSKCVFARVPTNAAVVDLIDGYGVSAPIPGGLSDGYLFARFRFSSDQNNEFLEQVEKSVASNAASSWKPLPLPGNIIKGKNYLDVPSATWHSDPLKPLPLNLHKGYYIFIDKQLTHPDRHTSTPWYDRSSINYVFAIYDEVEHELYFLECDT